MDKEITITNCRECPFCNYDNEYGYDSCNMESSIFARVSEQLPNDRVHELCPLRTQPVRISLSTPATHPNP